MKINIMLLSLCWFSFFACKTQKEKEETKSVAAPQKKVDPKIAELAGMWELRQLKDNYDGIWKDAREHKKMIALTDKGGYQEDNDGNRDCRGSFTREGDTISISNSCNRSILKYRVHEVTNDKLVLAIQGRHGDVLYEYKKIERSN